MSARGQQSIGVLFVAGLCVAAQAGVSQSTLVSPGGFFQAGADPASVGSFSWPGDDLALTINGAPVLVNPNGSFLAWLPVPPRENFKYELVANKHGDTARTTVDIAFPRPGPAAPPVPLVVM